MQMMNFRCFFLSLFLTFSAGGAAHEFSIEAEKLNRSQEFELTGDWLFLFGRFVAPESVTKEIEKGNLQRIEVPSDWRDSPLVPQSDRFANGKATYVAKITIEGKVTVPLALRVRDIYDHFRIYWLEEGSGQVSLLADSQNQKRPRDLALEDQIYPQSLVLGAGWIVVHVEKAFFPEGGIVKPIIIAEATHLMAQHDQMLILRTFMMGAIAIMFLYFLTQRFYVKENASAFYLALVCLFTFLRAATTTGIMDFTFTQMGFDFGKLLYGAEYILILIGPIAFVGFVNAMIPELMPKNVMKNAWMVTGVLAFVATITPFGWMVEHLFYIQVYALFWGVFVSFYLILAVVKRRRFSRSILFGASFLVFAAFHDVIASYSNTYNVYILEIAMFCFLFVQAHLVGITVEENRVHTIRLEQKYEKLESSKRQVIIESRQDHLTGLLNRKGFDIQADKSWSMAVANQQSIAVVLFDLDRFKSINDNYGHATGDEVLKFVSGVLSEQPFRPTDVLARYGGEEFVAVLPGADEEGAGLIAEKIRLAISQHSYEKQDIRLKVTSSFGVCAKAPKDNTSLSEAIELADQALYRAKDLGA